MSGRRDSNLREGLSDLRFAGAILVGLAWQEAAGIYELVCDVAG
jgi:hypothetical protein